MKVYKSIPSLISSGNLVCGAIAIFLSFSNNLEFAVYFILLASVFDFFDGFAARKLNAVSEFGKQLDSLADLISFGFAPTAMIYVFIENNDILPEYFSYLSILLVLFVAFRLAKFNIDESQSTEFKGLASPAMALFIVAVVYPKNFGLLSTQSIFLNKIFIIVSLVILPILMVSNIKLFSLKIQSLSFKNIIWQVALLISGILLLIIFGINGLAYLIILYLALSILKNLITKKTI
ncbi:MAG: CDP-diacylglycerol--serine O-phosphatidyltransferase [Bacteroidales bacterium]|jgi:CDP-diacylglycerol--serine O-phosphatidyltransferase|nr:CDP-diacylglycerol--serine O-phosphatidyltransferase [Bacteroidales bacterium]MCK9498679.1 CDP-diacylglycerol--serine O-phosphatidyltransferase [Bacteroidales bacterium]MDY0313546.1 CDP-diacylglycerol--serine O-phosphatidyltransferase [Bacteroidales bacterium]NLB85574.1 CDP-diacylglycerol--serine O-phosphatidyltransferase [Bacteroidales bacterium]